MRASSVHSKSASLPKAIILIILIDYDTVVIKVPYHYHVTLRDGRASHIAALYLRGIKIDIH